MTCIKVMPLYGYLKHQRLALLNLNPAVRDNRLILRVNFSFHAPRDAASGGLQNDSISMAASVVWKVST